VDWNGFGLSKRKLSDIASLLAERQALGVSVRKTLVEQTPLNTLHLPVIASFRSKIVFALRDPRDVV
jgi:hypothetical protein